MPIDKKEKEFRDWYAGHAKTHNLDPNPYSKEHYYDYKGAYNKGQGPGKDGHWPSEHKIEGHPRMNLMINGKMTNTKTGKVKGK
jgi:hypothetical protein